MTSRENDLFVGRSDYKITLVFRIKAQSRAMGNTADMQHRLNLHSTMSSNGAEFDAKRKRYFEYFDKW